MRGDLTRRAKLSAIRLAWRISRLSLGFIRGNAHANEAKSDRPSTHFLYPWTYEMRYPLRWSPSLKEQYARYWEDRTLWSFFEENAARRPERVAIVDGSNVVTYQQLASSVDSLTCSLIDLGIQEGDSVAFQLPNWWEAMALHLALVRLSAVSVPIATIYRERELSLILKDADVKAIVIPCGWKNCDYAAMIGRVSAPGLRARDYLQGAGWQ